MVRENMKKTKRIRWDKIVFYKLHRISCNIHCKGKHVSYCTYDCKLLNWTWTNHCSELSINWMDYTLDVYLTSCSHQRASPRGWCCSCWWSKNPPARLLPRGELGKYPYSEESQINSSLFASSQNVITMLCLKSLCLSTVDTLLNKWGITN